MDFTRFDNITIQAHIPVTIQHRYLLLNPEEKKNPVQDVTLIPTCASMTKTMAAQPMMIDSVSKLAVSKIFTWSDPGRSQIWNWTKEQLETSEANRNLHAIITILMSTTYTNLWRWYLYFIKNKLTFKLNKSSYLLSLFCLWLPGIEFHSVKLCEKQLFVSMFFHS